MNDKEIVATTIVVVLFFLVVIGLFILSIPKMEEMQKKSIESKIARVSILCEKMSSTYVTHREGSTGRRYVTCYNDNTGIAQEIRYY